jgi:hypothetical protein
MRPGTLFKRGRGAEDERGGGARVGQEVRRERNAWRGLGPLLAGWVSCELSSKWARDG